MSEQRGKETLNPERSDDYPTPTGVNVLTRLFFDGVVDLDPATSSENPVAARHFFTKAENGLAQSWQGYESVFINPPYSQEWYRKIADEVNAGATETIALLKASPCTHWAQEVILPPASAVCFIKGRLTFGNETSPARVRLDADLLRIATTTIRQGLRRSRLGRSNQQSIKGNLKWQKGKKHSAS